MVDAKGFDPPLLAQRERDEKPKFDQLRNGEVLVEFLPKSIIGDLGVPGDGTGVSKGDLFALAEFIRIGEIQ